MGLPIEKRRYTIAEYLHMEEASDVKHEFHEGEILAMAGNSYAHSKIFMNLAGGLRDRLRGMPCEPLDSNMRVRIPRHPNYVYPDLSIICGGPQFDADDKRQTTIVNPRIVIEILSASTEAYDRGEKFDLYRRIPDLEEYILVSQVQPKVDAFLRHHDGGWFFNPVQGLDATLTLHSLKISLPIREIYEGIQFPPSAIEEISA